MRVVIAGDFCPHSRVANLVSQGESFSLSDEVIKSSISEADFSLVNLECPLINKECKPAEKVGPSLGASGLTIDYIRSLGFKAVTLANNHFRDFGDEGVVNTLSLLSKNKIDFVGGGKNLKEAAKILYKNIGGEVIAFINCCEQEFSIASNDRAGSNPLDIIRIYNSIQEAKENSNYVVVIVHGGCEHYQLPTPRMVNTYRFFVEVGADAVVNHHQHCISGYENYNGKPIFYGLGNFCFDWTGKRNSNWNKGYMVMLTLENNNTTFEIIPYSQCDSEPIVRKLTKSEEKEFKDEITRLNSIINDEVDLSRRYNKFIQETSEGYQLALEPYTGRITKKLYSLHLLPSFWDKQKKILLGNIIRCDSHRERLLRILGL